MTPAEANVLADHLRSILPEQDAADVARWASNAQHVRELLKHSPTIGPIGDDDGPIAMCAECGVNDGESHRVVAFRFIEATPKNYTLSTPCRIAAAWRALGDPRGAEDIERAHEEALREHERQERIRGGLRMSSRAEAEWMRVVRANPQLAGALDTVAQGADRPVVPSPDYGFRLASESQAAAQARSLDRAFTPESMDEMAAHFSGVPVSLDEALMPNEYRLDGGPQRPSARFGARVWLWFQRSVSDARGMEAVEAEAWLLNTNVIAMALWEVDQTRTPEDDFASAVEAMRKL